MEQEPHQLNYSKYVGEYPSSPKGHPGIVLLMIGVTAVTGVLSIGMSLFYVGDFPLYAAGMFAAGVGLCWATIGKLPAAKPRLRPACVLLAIAVALHIAVVFLANSEYQRLLAQQHGELSQLKVRRMSTEDESVYSILMLRDVAAVFALIGVTLWFYVSIRLLARSGRELPAID